MLDMKRIKENPEAVKAGLRAKEVNCDETVDLILDLDVKVRGLKTATETATAQKNKLAKENGKLFGQKKGMEKRGEDTTALDAQIEANKAQSIALDAEIADDAEKLKDLSAQLRTAMLSLPNLPDPDLKPGGKENNEPLRYLDAEIADDAEKLKDLSAQLRTAMLSLPNLPDPDLKPGGKENNEPLRYIGEKHSFDFEPKHHVDLCQGLGLIDYERGVKLAGSGNWMYTGMGARLEWALLNYFIDCHIADGYDFILPPHMLEYQCGETAGQFPKFADEVYKIANPTDDRIHYMLPTAEAALCSIYRDEMYQCGETAGQFPKFADEVYKIANPTDDRIHYMLPTAEAALCSIYRDEILNESDLPRKLFAYTPCFRREAGSHRADERGMVRGHQFNKVEMFQFCKPEDSDAAFEELVHKAEKLVWPPV